MLTGSGSIATAWRRLTGALVLLLVLLLSISSGAEPTPPSTAPSASPPPVELEASGAPAAEVRTGTTSVEVPEPEAHPTAGHVAQTQERAPPLDSPRLTAREVSVPEPPASFNVYEGGWVRFAYPPSVLERVRPLISEADAIRSELSGRLAQSGLKKVTVYVARTPGEMATLAPPGAPYPKYAAGVAYPDIGLVLLTIHPVQPNANHDLGQIFRHELAHLALHDALSGRTVPRWFNEGFAVLVSGETSFARYQELMTATLSDTLLPFSEIERSFPADEITVGVAYAEAVDVVRFLMRQEEHHRFGALIERMKKGQSFESSLKDAYGLDLAMLEYEWREDVAKRYTFWPVLFSGSVVWVGTIGLFVWAWRRRKKRSSDTLERWAREEAAEDALKRKLAAAEASDRVHIVIARRNPPQLPPRPEVEVPKVEHDGQWHTLH